MLIRITALLLCLVLVSSCSTQSKLVKRHPTAVFTQLAAGSMSSIEQDTLKALKLQKKDPQAALATYLDVARSASQRFVSNPDDSEAIQTYNFALGRIIATLQEAGLEPWKNPVEVSGEAGTFSLTHRPAERKYGDPSLYFLTPSDEFEVTGEYFSKRTIRPGIGAPIVAASRETNPKAREIFAPPRLYYGVTAVVRFQGKECEIAFEDPLNYETIRYEGRNFPLAADFSVPLATMLEDDANNPSRQGLSRYFKPAEYDETAHIVGLQPYDPDKTVVLVIHGLASSQATWTPLINTLRGDPVIRQNFQFWFFSYPTGYPYPYAAMLLRRELERVQETFPLRKPMILVGHSMGGCISRLMITDSGEKLWRAILKHDPENTPISESSKKLLREALIFEHRSEVGRVIFLSAPLKGSEIASNWIGRLSSGLVRTPESLLRIGQEALTMGKFKEGELHVDRFPSSVDTLAPNNRFVRAINTIPVTPGIPHHVIVGDRGRGDSPDSSDGIVPYWSSHMDTAMSEKIVPSHHGSNAHPEGIAEVARILKLHALGGH